MREEVSPSAALPGSWSDDYAVDYGVIDAEHKCLFAIANRMFEIPLRQNRQQPVAHWRQWSITCMDTLRPKREVAVPFVQG